MLTLKKIQTAGIVNCIGIASMLCISGKCMATSIIPSLSYQDEPAVTRVENTLSAEEISQIQNIRQVFNQKLIVSKKQLAKVQGAFNQNLEIDTDETAIRGTFPPVAKAMEDIVVQQILMMQKVNKVIAAHMEATASVPKSLTQVALENEQEIPENQKR